MHKGHSQLFNKLIVYTHDTVPTGYYNLAFNNPLWETSEIDHQRQIQLLYWQTEDYATNFNSIYIPDKKDVYNTHCIDTVIMQVYTAS